MTAARSEIRIRKWYARYDTPSKYNSNSVNEHTLGGGTLKWALFQVRLEKKVKLTSN